MSVRHFNRRSFLANAGLGAMLPAGGLLLSRPAPAAQEWATAMPGSAFGFENVSDLAAELASEPFKGETRPLAEEIAGLTPKQYHAIRFRPEATLWREPPSTFQVQFFPRGSFFRREVTINIIDGDQVSPLTYSPDLFDFSPTGLPEAPPADLGFAGFRILHPLNREDHFDEVAVFLGASYFRLLAAGQHFGLSARALAIDTGLAKKEEFPYFRQIWLKKPQAGARSMEIFALLDTESLAGAYHFRLTPGTETEMEVRAKLFTRSAVEKLGIAPLTSMFLYGENSTRRVDDLRPEVHDSDGMLLATGRGEWIWRSLTNRDELQVSSFGDESPRGFGLLQRDRNSHHYQDLDFNYERRPSAWVEPDSPWGKGAAQLIEIPSDSERYDNIGLFWLPEKPVEAGQVWPFAYRLRFASSFPDFPATGRALATREAAGSREGLRRFSVEFGGGPLDNLEDESAVELIVSPSAGETFEARVRRNPATGTWFALFELDPQEHETVELRAFLKDKDHALTETWSYLWKPV